MGDGCVGAVVEEALGEFEGEGEAAETVDERQGFGAGELAVAGVEEGDTRIAKQDVEADVGNALNVVAAGGDESVDATGGGQVRAQGDSFWEVIEE